jgi:hypothetical protein
MLKIIWVVFFLVGCGEPSSSSLREAINSRNDPELIPSAASSLERTYRDLPLTGRVERVWTGWWWPMSEGGTASRRFNRRQSPMEKYDLATGSSAYNWEIQNSRQSSTAAWAGHCNGVAAAGVMLEEPVRPVVYNNVQFSVTDIKALLAETWQASGWIIGDRCNISRPTVDAYGRIKEVACRDLNPATLHIALTNFLGLFGKALILDVDNKSAVWNYPVYEYHSQEKNWYSASEAATVLHKKPQEIYTYNPQAIDVVHIQMTVLFAGTTTRVYEYFLELDLAGAIIGGEWVNGSKLNHPDFIWRPLDPKAYNPHLDIDVINEIYFNSI